MSTQLQTQAKTGSKTSDAATASNVVKRRFLGQRGFSAEAQRYPIQAKLKIGQPGDKYEQEAERVAERVMRMPGPAGNISTGFTTSEQPPIIQRMCPECEDKLNRKPISIQRFVQSTGHNIQRQCTECEEEIQRQPVEEEEEEEMLQAKESTGHRPTVTPKIHGQINSLQHGEGQPLSGSDRSFFEPRFGYDFSQVRVHTDARAAETTQAINARAYTVGQNIVFGAGEYSPETTPGKELLAHEFAHVVQQMGSRGEGITYLQRTIGDGHDLTASRFQGDAVLEGVYDDERLLKTGNRGPAVTKLQQALIDAGSTLPRFGADGIFGSETKAAVEGFQRHSGLTGASIDGIVGPITMGWLDQRFSAGPTPAGTGTGATAGCTSIKTVNVDIVSLDGSTRNPNEDLEVANTVFNQCCVRFILGIGVSATNTQTQRWLGGDTNLQRIHSCSSVHQEEKDLRENATVEFGLNSRYKVFYVASMTPALRGVNFSPDCSSGDRASFNRHLYVANTAARRTLAHELGHIPIVGLRDHSTHGDGNRNLMEPSNTATGEHLTAAQCREVVSNI